MPKMHFDEIVQSSGPSKPSTLLKLTQLSFSWDLASFYSIVKMGLINDGGNIVLGC
jgi:hypothetical protein